MTTELFWLMLTALLATSLWIPSSLGSTPASSRDRRSPSNGRRSIGTCRHGCTARIALISIFWNSSCPSLSSCSSPISEGFHGGDTVVRDHLLLAARGACRRHDLRPGSAARASAHLHSGMDRHAGDGVAGACARLKKSLRAQPDADVCILHPAPNPSKGATFRRGSLRLSVRTAASHVAKAGSIPAGSATPLFTSNDFNILRLRFCRTH